MILLDLLVRAVLWLLIAAYIGATLALLRKDRS